MELASLEEVDPQGREGQRPARAKGWWTGFLVTAGLWAFAAGCVSLGSLVPSHDAPPAGPACQVVATWTNQVAFVPDPVHNGEPAPGLAGRVYLFGQTIDFPVAGAGSMVFDLFDDAHPVPGKGPVLLEEWRFDPDTLKRLLCRDAIGWGYTVFLPWGTYRPDITRVHLKVCYTPVNGTPIYASCSPMTLTKDDAAHPVVESPPAAVPGGNPVSLPLGTTRAGGQSPLAATPAGNPVSLQKPRPLTPQLSAGQPEGLEHTSPGQRPGNTGPS
ncbi:MAG: hypothetical protein JO112_05800 [Planctomycetes bacterium]|nr:hypothetical protein [Planctomycetota bacterium]